MRRNSDMELGMEMVGLEVPRRKRRRRSCSNGKKVRMEEEEETNDEAEMAALFPLLVAAISKQRDGRKEGLVLLIKKCLKRLRLWIASSDDHRSLPVAILSVIPPILSSRVPSIACLGADVIGLACLQSFEMNRQISSEGDILKTLLLGLSRENRRVRMRFCNVILDVCCSFSGQKRLLELSALETLMSCFLQVGGSLPETVMLHAIENGSRSYKIAATEDELPFLVLGAAFTLIKSCNIERLASIMTKQSRPFFNLLLKLWSKLRQQMLLHKICSCKGDDVCPSDICVSDVAESIFRLSTYSQHSASLPNQDTERIIFGRHGSTFKNFIMEHWEHSPFLFGEAFQPFVRDDVIGSALGCINSKDVIQHFFSSIFPHMVSCPPISSDEFDIVHFINKEREELGRPLTYEQDIRVLKTERNLNREDHLFQGEKSRSCEDSPHVFSIEDIRKCEEAFNSGHTIAIRGMEFRFKSIAAVVEGLANLFGQPSMGVNLYLTPPDSQGLARHYDDHCVFVCQLLGSKEWMIFPPNKCLLPRLYECSYGSDVKEVGSIRTGGMSIPLKEGDILYVPRGFLHEACTTTHSPSLHLTFAVEVEAPFQWEGFMHVALRHWFLNARELFPLDASIRALDMEAMRHLHIGVMLLGDTSPLFRKACLVNSSSSYLNANNWLYENQRAHFQQLLHEMSIHSMFTEACHRLTQAIHTKEDPFQRISWLQDLDKNEESSNECRIHNMYGRAVKDMYQSCFRDQEKVEAAFLLVKSRFCEQVSFDDVTSRYRLLLERYRKVRTQYANGMLSLHHLA
ncbi:hypothetical protein MLD38_014171 [Melastoma candidum]|uniref:Uncharacterized protein n=1 Tax=Melastoma candidum TaxID=119954 RepID=A0ACB9RD31_9MYRT|nr:hypothetical protein MLD38_014171 [Melastoma candidum]